MLVYSNARDALRHATAHAPAVVGWQVGGWIIYDPTQGAPIGVEPELLAIGLGRWPIALSDTGAAVLGSLLRAAL